MTTITVKASDTTLAMEEVERRLGVDAFIVSTRKVRGQIEMVASNERPRTPNIHAGKTFGDVLKEREKAGLPLDLEAVVSERAENSKAKEALRTQPDRFSPNIAAPMGGWPLHDEAFIAAVSAELSQEDRFGEGPLDQIYNAVFDEKVERWLTRMKRVVVLGAEGAGVSNTAARLAVAEKRRGARNGPTVLAPSPAMYPLADEMSVYARLVGFDLLRPKFRDLITEQNPSETRKGAEVLDLAAQPEIAPDTVSLLLEPKGARAVLVLQAGMHPAHLSRICRRWAQVNPIVCLSRVDSWGVTPEELTAIGAAGLKVGLVAEGSGITAPIRPVSRELLDQWAEGWLMEDKADRLSEIAKPVRSEKAA